MGYLDFDISTCDSCRTIEDVMNELEKLKKSEDKSYTNIKEPEQPTLDAIEQIIDKI